MLSPLGTPGNLRGVIFAHKVPGVPTGARVGGCAQLAWRTWVWPHSPGVRTGKGDGAYTSPGAQTGKGDGVHGFPGTSELRPCWEGGGGQRCVDSKHSQTTPATTSTSSIRQLLGAVDTQTAHHATSSTAPAHQLLGSANAETTPASRDADSQRIQFEFAEFAANSFAARIRCEFGLKFLVLRIRGEFALRICRRRQNDYACAVFSPDEKLTLNCAMQEFF